jgi:DNA-directed RNA polymerase specialized sigma24 family protein
MATLVVSNQSLDQLEDRSTRQLAGPDRALKRAAQLRPDDRVLVELLLQRRLSFRQVATILKQTPGTISRRFRRVTNRLADPMVDSLLDTSLTLARQYRQIGLAYFLQGQTVPTIARAQNLPPAEVKQILMFLRVWHRGMLAR